MAADRFTEPDLPPTGYAKIVPIIAVAISVLDDALKIDLHRLIRHF
ncbi:hypothetical protein MAXJ12_10598 [Mesorhizobium alhagi CCNWXJ12-2]|uniref:Uncharacterized protein n=1 Tax=Mesorhizobium alhagi CCNWXJ12-2 TaxID=1107882 RepID=H0HPP0_9HYPH|nr:hypothetical protein MAXJ12_10598 [Mesorhizobium alhagi CCNWXJ12-2]